MEGQRNISKQQPISNQAEEIIYNNPEGNRTNYKQKKN